MKVILKEDVENLGQLGDVKEVAPGYARNFLIPRGLVIAATPRNMAQVEHQRRLIDAKVALRRDAAQGKAAQIAALSVSVTVKVGEDGRLFGSVTAKDLIAKLADQGIEVDRHAIVLDHPVKSVGKITVPVNLGHGVSVDLKVVVSGEAEAEAVVADAPQDDTTEEVTEA